MLINNVEKRRTKFTNISDYTKGRTFSFSSMANQGKSPLDLKIHLYSTDIRNKMKEGQTLNQIPFIYDDKMLKLLLHSFSKSFRNQDDILLIEHYLMTFPNLMKTIYQKKYLYDTSELLNKIAVYLRCEAIEKNTLICRLGEIGDKFYLIFQGSVGILIPKEIKGKMDIEEYLSHLNHLFQLKEYDLILRTISSNNHIFMNAEIFELKMKLETEIELYYTFQEKEILTIKEYISRLEPYTENENTNKKLSNIGEKEKEYKKQNIILWSYYYVTNITQGQTFGDIALSDDIKRRTASIISLERCYCGTLNINVYKSCIKDAQEKIRKMNICFLLSINVLHGIESETFDNKYFNFFKHIDLKRGDILFKEGEIRNDIYFVKEGEIEVNLFSSFKELNYIINKKGGETKEDEIEEINKTKKSEQFNNFYFGKKKKFRLFVISQKEVIGLDEFVVDEVFYLSGKCISQKGEIYAIDKKILFDLFVSEKKENKVKQIIKKREKIIVERLREIKKNLIQKRFETFNDKNNSNEKIRKRPENKIEKNQIIFFDKLKLHQKRLFSADTVKRTEREKYKTLTNSNGMFKNVQKLNIIKINKKNSVQNKSSIVSLFINGIPKANTLEKKYINNQDITQELKEEKSSNAYYNILSKVTKKRKLSEEKKENYNERRIIDPLIFDKILEQEYPKIFKRNNSESKFHNQLTIEKFGERKRIKLKIPPPIPYGKKIIQ